ncbi:MAG: hypothetical protein HY815_10265 [Candidatus Riflebacteria bacterium]|nr:hypothetical protein [Candidatus Riflebacteria bacterium]
MTVFVSLHAFSRSKKDLIAPETCWESSSRGSGDLGSGAGLLLHLGHLLPLRAWRASRRTTPHGDPVASSKVKKVSFIDVMGHLMALGLERLQLLRSLRDQAKKRWRKAENDRPKK